ncbi:MAG: metal-dependent transcriptional regulator [Desulfuromonadales bacterium]|nr:metal-dependent transcriptional regulator [Desulfuromonadales bacterium]NIR33048.1 metal-dependent transcriptional regulator [Desulfuromonadales bacterium]NIS43067.1 metal-dependent transcriptional regulator [Desulfuromonadales bacterium]
MKLTEKAEEILETLWIATQEQGDICCTLQTLGVGPGDDGLTELERLGYIEVGEEGVFLRGEGEPEARMTVRRHRLAERLMTDVLDIRGSSVEARACEFEHLLHKGVDAKICALLNHPTTCPHGMPIPPGECCEKAKKSGDIGVVPMTELKPGQEGEIAYLSTIDGRKMQKLMSMGVLPGNSVTLRRAFPSYIFRVGNSEFAVDADLAREIFVRRS